MTGSVFVGVVRRGLDRLRRGIRIPGVGVHVALDVRRTARSSPSDASNISEGMKGGGSVEEMAHKIVVSHNHSVMKKVPQLKRFHHPEFDADIASASAFLNFLNDAMVLFNPAARGVHLRRQLMRLGDRQLGEAARTVINREIAISDLDDGVVERALTLLDDPTYGNMAISERDAFDAEYGALPPFLSVARQAIDFSQDVRGNSLIWFLKRNTDIFAGKRILHVAPEAGVEQFFRSDVHRSILRYETLDGFSETVDHLQDLTALSFDNNSLDLILCHRVLEHIIDDIGAMQCMFRILAPGGILNVSVPQSMNLKFTNEWLAQDTSHHEHVRQYGRDFVDRLSSVGFVVEADRQLLEKSLAEHRADGSYPMRHYICIKPADGDSPDSRPRTAMP